MIHFLYHLKTIHDPHHVGLLNLAVDVENPSETGLYDLLSQELKADVRLAFIETLTQLTQVWFVSTPLTRHQIVGPSGESVDRETRYQRSVPIMTTSPTFDYLCRDPRPIGQDLKRTPGRFLWRCAIHNWLRLLKKWRTCPPRIEYRFVLAYDSRIRGGQIRDDMSAKAWLQEEDNHWNGLALDDSSLEHEQGDWLAGAGGEDVETAVKPAFGFWLFPVAALGAIDENGLFKDKTFLTNTQWDEDMTEHWPELALSRLP